METLLPATSQYFAKYLRFYIHPLIWKNPHLGRWLLYTIVLKKNAVWIFGPWKNFTRNSLENICKFRWKIFINFGKNQFLTTAQFANFKYSYGVWFLHGKVTDDSKKCTQRKMRPYLCHEAVGGWSQHEDFRLCEPAHPAAVSSAPIRAAHSAKKVRIHIQT